MASTLLIVLSRAPAWQECHSASHGVPIRRFTVRGAQGCSPRPDPTTTTPPVTRHTGMDSDRFARAATLTRAQPQCCRLLLLRRLLPPGSAPTHPPTARHRPQCRSSLGPLGPPLLKPGPSPRDHQPEVPSDQRCMCDSEPSWPAQSSALCHRAVRAHNASCVCNSGLLGWPRAGTGRLRARLLNVGLTLSVIHRSHGARAAREPPSRDPLPV